MSNKRHGHKPKISKPDQHRSQQTPPNVVEEPEPGTLSAAHWISGDTDKDTSKFHDKAVYDGAKLVVEALTLIAVVFYAWYAYRQADYTGRLVTISQDQQRPYLWAVAVPKKSDGQIFYYSTNEVNDYALNKQPVEVKINVFVKNSGHSPATEVIASRPYVGYYPKELFNLKTVERDYEAYLSKDEGMIIAPDSYITIEDVDNTKTNMFEVNHPGYVVAIVGKIKYTDLWHRGQFPYETTYCNILIPAPYVLPQVTEHPVDRVANCHFGSDFK